MPGSFAAAPKTNGSTAACPASTGAVTTQKTSRSDSTPIPAPTPGEPSFFDTRERAGGSPLPERLFALDGVAHVLVVDNVVTVGKQAGTSWNGLRAEIGGVIRAQLLTGIPAILEAPRAPSAWGRSDAEVRAVIQELLDGEVNRSIANHGGQISIVDVHDGVLSISMSGGCQGCAASNVTLRQGFEVMVRRVAPGPVRSL